MRRTLSFLAALFAVCPAGAADLLVAGAAIHRLDLATFEITTTSAPLSSPASDVEASARFVLVATGEGLVSLDALTLTPLASLDLGTLDSVELSPGGDVAYVLVHPPGSRTSARGRHRILEIPVDTAGLPGEPRQIATTGHLSYDAFLSPDGRRMAVTNNISRSFDLVDLTTGAVESHLVTAGGQDNELAILRAARWTDDRTLLIGESARGRPLILWTIDLDPLEFSSVTMPWRMHALGLDAHGDLLYVNGLDQLGMVRGPERAPVRRADVYRDATDMVVTDEGVVLLVAPADDGGRILRFEDGKVVEAARFSERVSQLDLGPTPGP